MIDRLAELLEIAEEENENEDGIERDERVAEAGPPGLPGRRRTAPAQEGMGAPEGTEETGALPEALERAVREADAVQMERGGARRGDGEAEPRSPAPAEGEAPDRAAPFEIGGEAGRPAAAGPEGDRSGLELLYREAARAAEPVFPAAADGPADRALPEPGPTPSAPVSLEELDRAMRRDSRRYDGGMTIY